MKIPFRLLSVPSFQHELTIKASAAGIIVLKEGRFKKRYTGSRHSAIDINGKLYLKAADLKKINQDQEKKQRARVKASTQSDVALIADQIQRPPKSYKVHKTEVRNRIMGMINTMRGKKELYFWTVTFPAGTPDTVAYRLFQTWLTTCRQKKVLKEYLWIAERQTGERLEDKSKATNTIHFHLAIPHFMNAKTTNKFMQITLATAAKKKEINFSVYQCKRYNGVHLAKDKKTNRVVNFALKKKGKALGNYLSKYVTKNNTPLPHLAWHNSRGFSALFTGITFTTNEFLGYGFRGLVNPGVIINNEYFMFFAWKEGPPYAVTRHLCEINSWIQERNNTLPSLN